MKVTHDKVKKQSELESSFKQILAQRLPHIETFSEDALDNVYEIFVRKVCNTRIQEVISAAKQQMASKKGLASTIDTNLWLILLAHHTKLETKLGHKCKTLVMYTILI